MYSTQYSLHMKRHWILANPSSNLLSGDSDIIASLVEISLRSGFCDNDLPCMLATAKIPSPQTRDLIRAF